MVVPRSVEGYDHGQVPEISPDLRQRIAAAEASSA